MAGSLIQVATELGTRSSGPGSVAMPTDNGVAQAAQSFAGDFASVGARIGAMADHAAQAEGSEAGKLAGLDPEFRPTHNRTLRGDAYDKAGLQIAGAQLNQQIAADFQAAADQHQANPAKLASTLKAKADAWRAKTIPDLLPDVELHLQSHTFTLLRQASRAHDAQVAQQQQAALQTQVSEGMRQLSQQAYASGLDPEADAILARNLASIQSRLSAKDLRGRPLVDPVTAAKLVENAKQEVATSRTFGAFDRLPDLAAKKQFIDKFKADFAAGAAGDGAAGGAYDYKHFTTVFHHLETQFARAKAEDGVAVRMLTERVGEVARLAEKGRVPSPDDMAAIEGQVAMLGNVAKAEKLDVRLADARVIYDLTRTAEVARPDEVDQYVRNEKAKMQAEGATFRQSHVVDHLEKLGATMRTALKTDPLGWADGRLLKVPALDVSGPQQLAASLSARIPLAEHVGDHYQHAYQYVRPEEKAQIAAGIAKGGSEGAAWLSAVVGAAGERSPAIMKELNDHAPVMAALGGLAHVVGPQAAVVRDALNGLALARTEGHKDLTPLPKPDQVRAAAAGVVGDALGRAGKDDAAILTLTNRVYAVRAGAQQLTEFSKEEWQKALREVLGERTVGSEVYGGVAPSKPGWLWGGSSNIVLPVEVKQKRWRDVVGMITPEDLAAAGIAAPVGSDGKPVGLDRIKSGALIQAGYGRYQVALGDPAKAGAEGLVMAGDGKKPFTLDMTKLVPILRRRRKDLFLGGD